MLTPYADEEEHGMWVQETLFDRDDFSKPGKPEPLDDAEEGNADGSTAR